VVIPVIIGATGTISKSFTKYVVIPVIIGATGTISKSFRKHVSDIPGNHDVRNYRKQPYWALHTDCGKC
jgi:hypothetical protein